MLPTYLMDGPLTWPGQTCGVSRTRSSTRSRLNKIRTKAGFREESLTPASRLLGRADGPSSPVAWRTRPASVTRWPPSTANDPMADQRELAYSLLLSGKVAQAFDLDREDPEITRQVRSAHVWPVNPPGTPAGRSGCTDRPGEHGPGAELGHALGEFQAAQKRPPAHRSTSGIAALLDDLAAIRSSSTRLWSSWRGSLAGPRRIGASTGNAQYRRWSRPLVQMLLGGFRRRRGPAAARPSVSRTGSVPTQPGGSFSRGRFRCNDL